MLGLLTFALYLIIKIIATPATTRTIAQIGTITLGKMMLCMCVSRKEEPKTNTARLQGVFLMVECVTIQ